MSGTKRPKANVRDRRKLARLVTKLRPQYALDGKARRGCVSAKTGRHEIDLTLFCPDTKQVLAIRTLADKEGEPKGAQAILAKEGKELPPGVITGDAGILSPHVIDSVLEAGHEYIFGIKGNAGQVYDRIASHDWKSIAKSHENYTVGHGREEYRSLKRIATSAIEDSDLFLKYMDVGYVYQMTRLVKTTKSGKITKEVAYFVGSVGLATYTYPQIQAYIRDHWKQEAFHWIKDVVLGEDESHQKRHNGSRVLGILRDAVIDAAMRITGSTKKFLNRFSADPKGTLNM